MILRLFWTRGNRVRKLIPIIVIWLFLPFTASAFQVSCWILTNLSGVATFQSDGYKIEPDGFTRTNPTIKLVFGGNGATASGDNIGLNQSADYAATGAASNSNFSIAETYLVDPLSKTVLYTKATFGYGAFAGMTGTKMFRGKAMRCKP